MADLTGAETKVWLILFRDTEAATGTARTGTGRHRPPGRAVGPVRRSSPSEDSQKREWFAWSVGAG